MASTVLSTPQLSQEASTLRPMEASDTGDTLDQGADANGNPPAGPLPSLPPADE